MPDRVLVDPLLTSPVVIAGAGVAGCAAALALHRAGVPVSVREAHPETTRDQGAFLTLASGGVRALAELEVLDGVDAAGMRLGRFHAQQADGTIEVTRPLGAGGPAYRLITRSELCRVLQDAVLARGIDLRRDAQVVAVEDADDTGGVLVDAGGGRERAALVVAADGLRSGLRAVVEPEGPDPRYVGQRIFYGWSERGDLGVVGDFHVVRGPCAFGYVPTGAGTWWFARVTAPPLGRAPRTSEEVNSVLWPHVEGIQAEIAGASTTTWVTDGHDLPWVSRWHGHGVLLVGDAAHAASPATGQGASMALEDGVVLGKAFRDGPDVATAVAAYESQRRDRVQANIVASARLSTPDQPLDGAPQGRAMTDDEVAAMLTWDDVLT